MATAIVLLAWTSLVALQDPSTHRDGAPMPVPVSPRFVEWPERAGGAPVAFRCTSGGALTELRADGFAATLVTAAGDSSVGARLVLAFEGGNPNIRLEGTEPGRGRSHVFRGADSRTWTPDLGAYQALRASGAYVGVDLVWYFGARGELEYDLRLAAGADPSSIVVRVDGADSLAIDHDGALRIATPLGAIRQTAPIATQESASGDARRVACAFRLVDSQRYGFAVEGHDSARALRIDPGIVYATLIGGRILEVPAAIDVDAAGAAYLTGRTGGDFPTTPGAFDTTFNGGFWGDAFLTKVDPSGGSLAYSTYVGGTWNEFGRAVSVDGSGCATIGIYGGSPELPTTPGCYQSQTGGLYIAKFNATGSALQFATNFGGFNTTLRDMAIGPQGDCFVGGEIYSPELPATPGAFSTNYAGGTTDGWAAKLDSTGSSLVYATYLGGFAQDLPTAVAVDSTGSLYIVGETGSPDYPTAPIAGPILQPTLNGGWDCFITKLSPSGGSLDFSTFLGGTLDSGSGEQCMAVALDKAGSVHVVGWTTAKDFPVTPGAVDMGPGHGATGPAAFVGKIAPDGSALTYCTRFVSTNMNAGIFSHSVAIDGNGNAVFCGCSYPPYLSTPDALTYVPGKYDAFVTILSPLGLGLTYSTLYGASKNDGFELVKLDPQGNVYLLGGTVSPDFPTTPGAYDSTLADPSGDMTVVKMFLPTLPLGTSNYGVGLAGCSGPQSLRTEASVRAAGGTMTLECDHVPANSLGLILVSDIQDANGTDPLFLGVPFHVGLSPNMFGLNIVSGTTDPAFLTVPLPNLSGLVGSTFYFQAFWLWPQAICTPSPFGLSASNGHAVTVIP